MPLSLCTAGNTGFAARIETVNTVDAYFGSFTGHGVENVRRPLVNTLYNLPI